MRFCMKCGRRETRSRSALRGLGRSREKRGFNSESRRSDERRERILVPRKTRQELVRRKNKISLTSGVREFCVSKKATRSRPHFCVSKNSTRVTPAPSPNRASRTHPLGHPVLCLRKAPSAQPKPKKSPGVNPGFRGSKQQMLSDPCASTALLPCRLGFAKPRSQLKRELRTLLLRFLCRQ